MYIIFTNRYYILEFLKKKKKLEFVYCEKNSYAEIYCKKNTINYKNYVSKQESYKMLIKSVKKKIILNGYKFIIPEKIIKRFRYIPINIHPSLLPDYKGQLIVKKMFKDKPKNIGATVHYITKIVDEGPILSQAKIKFDKKITKIDLYQILFKLEVVAFKKFFNGKVLKVFS